MILVGEAVAAESDGRAAECTAGVESVCGDAGGSVIACGTPEEIARVGDSYTGQYLAKVLKG